MHAIKTFLASLIDGFVQNFSLILTIAVLVCLIFYIIDGFTYRKERRALQRAFQNHCETEADRNAFRARLARILTLPPESIDSPNPWLKKINAWRFHRPVQRHREKLAILAKLDAPEGEALNKREIAWLKEPVYPMEKFIEFFSGVFWVLFVVWFFRSFLYEPFRIPSGSMEPTLYAGDFILTDKHAYGVRLPVLDKTIIPVGDPKRGDVIVFRYPLNEKIDFIKRVIGVPGDKIRFDLGKVWINGQEQTWQDPVPDGEYKMQWRENLLGHPHAMQTYPQHRNPWLGEVTVPAGHYFVMGDNRDDSEDSRRWGFVPRQNIIGKANLIWFNSNCLFGKGDCNHIGKTIH